MVPQSLWLARRFSAVFSPHADTPSWHNIDIATAFCWRSGISTFDAAWNAMRDGRAGQAQALKSCQPPTLGHCPLDYPVIDKKRPRQKHEVEPGSSGAAALGKRHKTAAALMPMAHLTPGECERTHGGLTSTAGLDLGLRVGRHQPPADRCSC